MNAERTRNLALLRRLYQGLASGQVDEITAAFSPTIVLHVRGAGQLDGTFRGLEEARSLYQRVLAALGAVTVPPYEVLVHDETLVVVPQGSGFGDAWRGLDVYHVENGVFSEAWITAWPAEPDDSGRNGLTFEADRGLESILRAAERERLRALVTRDRRVAERLHADDYELITPGGGTMTKREYLDSIASGELDYLVFEPASEIQVRLYDRSAILRYSVRIEIVVNGAKDSGTFWHTDAYELRDDRWQAVWSQATRIREQS